MDKNNSEFKASVAICNELGLHARAAALFVKSARKFPCRILVKKGTQEVDGKSIMGLMMLEATKGSSLKIIAKGKQAEVALAALEKLVKDKFGEDE